VRIEIRELGYATALALGIFPGSAPAVPQPELIEEVIVTARKHEESLAAVPLAMSALSAAQLERAGVDGLQALSGQVPGLYFESMWGGANSAPTLRGQAQPNAAGDNVGVFVDGIYQDNNASLDAAMLDLERIEVIKGPQSALYGHSTFAGAINYVTRSPTDMLSGDIALEAGSDAYRGVSAALSGPIGTRGLRARIALAHREFDGTGMNRLDRRDHLGGYRNNGASLRVDYTPNERWRIDAALRATRDRQEHPGSGLLPGSEYNCGGRSATSGLWSYFCGSLPRPTRFDVSPELPDSSINTRQQWLRVTRDGEQWNFDSLSAYYRGSADQLRDFDLEPGGELFGVCTTGASCFPGSKVDRFLRVENVNRGRSLATEYSQELRLRRTGEQFDVMLGAQAFRVWRDARTLFGAGADLLDSERLTALLPATPELVGPPSILNSFVVADSNTEQRLRFETITKQTTIAAFAAIDVHVGPRVTIHAEGRESRERFRDICPADNCPQLPDAVTFNSLTPRFSLSFAPADNQLLWISAARGERSGGSNADATLIPQEQYYRPQSNWTYEIGFRGRLFDDRLALDAALFHIDWHDAQVLGPSNAPGDHRFILQNLHGVRTRGVEGALAWELSPRWRASGSYAYVNARFTDGSEDVAGIGFCGITPANPASTFCTIGPARNGAWSGLIVPYIDGNEVQRAPRQQWSAALEFDSGLLGNGMRWYARTQAEYQADVYVLPIEGARNGRRTLLGARVGAGFRGWSLELWGRNLTDAKYVRAVIGRGPVFYPTSPRPFELITGDRRTVGLALRYGF